MRKMKKMAKHATKFFSMLMAFMLAMGPISPVLALEYEQGEPLPLVGSWVEYDGGDNWFGTMPGDGTDPGAGAGPEGEGGPDEGADPHEGANPGEGAGGGNAGEPGSGGTGDGDEGEACVCESLCEEGEANAA